MAKDHHNLSNPINYHNQTQTADFKTSFCLWTSNLLLTFYPVVDAVEVTGQLWL
ncbi:MAG TPA: hypothetical protein VK203_25285 [Nostocaceae cyanobacterium]|nr:hypothetical protein [Nostocaceae cyanobacterium]